VGLNSPTKESLGLTQATMFKEIAPVPSLNPDAFKEIGSKEDNINQFPFVDEPTEHCFMIEGLKMGGFGMV